ncbi:hypothetical protein BBG47_27935 [Paenibacillus sp. KS1]|nr:hypothetical protein BBG47_27935 [Paenibacillus sp. KS1]
MQVIVEVDKRHAIIQAALEEFTHKGYEGASTNQITKSAGVSKGILFHYFSDKRTLYLTLVDECLNHYFHTMTSNLPDLSDDLLEALGQLSKIKMDAFKREPMKYRFITNAFMTMTNDLKKELHLKQQRMKAHMVDLLASKVDRNRFRRDIEPEQAIEFVLLSLEALLAKQMNSLNEQELDGSVTVPALDMSLYLQLLKYGVYREAGI